MTGQHLGRKQKHCGTCRPQCDQSEVDAEWAADCASQQQMCFHKFSHRRHPQHCGFTQAFRFSAWTKCVDDVNLAPKQSAEC